jgi:hypothetical protein
VVEVVISATRAKKRRENMTATLPDPDASRDTRVPETERRTAKDCEVVVGENERSKI